MIDKDKQIELSVIDPHYCKIARTDDPYTLYLLNYIIPLAKRRWENDSSRC